MATNLHDTEEYLRIDLGIPEGLEDVDLFIEWLQGIQNCSATSSMKIIFTSKEFWKA